jgi:uncharacterized protein
MIEEVFVDTVAWIALLDEADSLHNEAHQVLSELETKKCNLVTTEFVLLELGDGFSAVGKREQAVNFIEELRKSDILRIIPVSQELLGKGWELYSKRADKTWQVTDCVSFVVMQKENITTAFTADKHFVQAGFIALLK